MDMGCDRIREAVSARIDGEDFGPPPGALEAHLAECAACQEWEQHAYVVARRAQRAALLAVALATAARIGTEAAA